MYANVLITISITAARSQNTDFQVKIISFRTFRFISFTISHNTIPTPIRTGSNIFLSLSCFAKSG
jgi:hypothetical protein